MCRNIDILAGVVYYIQRHKFPFSNSVLTTPAGKKTIVNDSKFATPATPSRLRREESYLATIQIITVVFIIFGFLRLTAMECGYRFVHLLLLKGNRMPHVESWMPDT